MKLSLCVSLCLISVGCGQPSAPELIGDDSSNRFSESLFLEFYSHSAAVRSQLLITQTKNLQEAVTAFLFDPNLDNLDAAQRVWLSAHQSFLEANFYVSATKPGMPSAASGSAGQLPHMIDAWPMQEGFLDSLQLYPTSGIINDLTLSIDEQTLRNQHGITAAEEVSLGFHAIEFLLWARPITDFPVQSELTADQQNDGLRLHQLSNNRRRETLRLIVKLLHDDIVGQNQQPAAEAPQPATATTHNLRGAIQACTEALQSMQRELLLLTPGDEASGHSRFSNSSAQDLLTYMQTLVFVYSDPGRLHELFESLDPELASQFATLAKATLQRLTELDAKLDPSTLLELNRSLSIMIDHSQELESMLGS